MSETFVPDPVIKEIAEAYALDAVESTLRNMKLVLDWSEASVHLVEFVLNDLHRQARNANPTREQVYTVAKVFGSYVGEVFIRHHGGAWGMVTLGGETFPGIRAAEGGGLFWPWGRAMNRLENGPEDNIWHYYLHLTGRLKPDGETATTRPPSK